MTAYTITHVSEAEAYARCRTGEWKLCDEWDACPIELEAKLAQAAHMGWTIHAGPRYRYPHHGNQIPYGNYVQMLAKPRQ